jgi:hypothetical protein
MPTDLDYSARKREAKAQAQNETTILLVVVIICLLWHLALVAEKTALQLVGLS